MTRPTMDEMRRREIREWRADSERLMFLVSDRGSLQALVYLSRDIMASPDPIIGIRTLIDTWRQQAAEGAA